MFYFEFNIVKEEGWRGTEAERLSDLYRWLVKESAKPQIRYTHFREEKEEEAHEYSR
jgi:hypothetical protein